MRILFLLLFFIFKIQILFLFYLKFLDSKVIKAKVINQYKKGNHFVLRLKNKEIEFYTTSYENLKNLLNDEIELTLIKKDVSFFDYLTPFYAPSYNLRLLPLNKVETYIEAQHESRKFSNLFRALFLGESIDYDTRIKLSALGISHLFALSGLHLGFISGTLFFLLLPIYTFFHRFFPYRNRYVDLGILILGIEFFYLYFTSFPPSLIRAFLMEAVLFGIAFFLMDVFSMKVLVFTIGIAFLIFTFSVFKLGFLLSIVGVYYIYLFFRYFKFSFINGVLLSFYMFIVMFVWSHYFFGEFNNYQLLSPLINLIFPIFYVVEGFLHLIGYGGVLDGVIKWYLNLGEKYYHVNVSFCFLVVFSVLSLLAYRKKWAFYGINLLAVIIILGSIKI